MSGKTPLVSVITPTLNVICAGRENTLKRCIESVQKQDYEKIEHIIIDGASCDGTLALLEEHQAKYGIKYISKQDKGIYDAMNKGVACSSGDYIIFLNSDDCFIDDSAIRLGIEEIYKHDVDFCYSKAVYRDGRGKEYFDFLQCNPNMGYILFFMPFCHQTMIASRKMFERNLFNIEHKSISDYEWLLKNILNGARGIFLKRKTIEFRLGGMCDKLENRNMIRQEQLEMYHNVFGEICPELTKLDCKRIIYERYIPSVIFDVITEKISFDIYQGERDIEKLDMCEELQYAWEKAWKMESQLKLQQKYIEACRLGMNVASCLRNQGYQNCAIYGFGVLGQWIAQDLEEQEFQVCYIIDKRAVELKERGYTSIFKDLEEELPTVDVIIITPIFDMNSIISILKKRVTCPIKSIEEVIDYV